MGIAGLGLQGPCSRVLTVPCTLRPTMEGKRIALPTPGHSTLLVSLGPTAPADYLAASRQQRQHSQALGDFRTDPGSTVKVNSYAGKKQTNKRAHPATKTWCKISSSLGALGSKLGIRLSLYSEGALGGDMSGFWMKDAVFWLNARLFRCRATSRQREKAQDTFAAQT